MVNEPPVATCVVPAAFEYQYNVPFPVAVNVAVCPHPTVEPVALGKEIGVTVTVTGTRLEAHEGGIGVITTDP